MYRPISLTIKNLLSWEEVKFNFRIGESVIIVGDNRDDEGQKGNGAGKSGLTEGCVIAISGGCVRRGVKSKEIVRRGCESGEATIVLFNSMLNTEIKIWRKLYSGSKSAEYRMWENEVDQCNSYSDFNGFNAYVWKTLGISSEDFFNFYILEKTTKPYLAIGDTEKKQIVSRFSGADKVDQALPFIESDIAAKQKIVKTIDDQINSTRGKQELLSDQILQEQEKYSEENKKKELEQINESLSEHTAILKLLKEEAESHKNSILAKEKELRKLKPIDYSQEKKTITDKKAAVDQNVLKVEKEIKEAVDRKKDIIKIIGDLEKSLAGLIQCPKCKNEFTLEGDDVEADKADLEEVTKEMLPEVENELANLREQILSFEKIRDGYNAELRALSTKEDEELQTKRSTTNKIDQLESLLKKNLREQDEANSKIAAYQNKRQLIKKGESEELDNLNEQLKKYMNLETELFEKFERAVDEKASVERWSSHFKSFKSYLANKSIANIQDYTNMYLSTMGSNIQIIIEGYKVLANKKLKEEITTIVRRNGLDDASYGTYSGGEKGRIDICTVIAIQTLINLNSTTGGLDLLLLDEWLDSVDSLGLENITRALQNIDRTIMIVSQNEINSIAEHTITIRKQNRKSTIV